jgi:hypothetical protein
MRSLTGLFGWVVFGVGRVIVLPMSWWSLDPIQLSPLSTSRKRSLRGFRMIGRMTWFGRGWCVARSRACPPVSISHPCGSAIPPSGWVSVNDTYAMSSPPGLSVSHRNTSLASPVCGLSSPVRVPLAQSWAQLAGDAGFYDQLHMAAEFRKIMRVAPGVFTAGRLPVARC